MRCISLIPLALLFAGVGPDSQDRSARVPVIPPPAALQDASEVPHLLSTRDRWMVRVFDKDTKKPIAGARIWSSYSFLLTLVTESRHPLPATTTNVHGEAVIDLVEIRKLSPVEQSSGSIRAYAASPGYLTESMYLSPSSHNWNETLADLEARRTYDGDAYLEKGRCLIGRVVDSNGAPVCNARVSAGRWDEEAWEWTSPLESSCYLRSTEPGGHFSFDLKGSSFSLRRSKELDLIASHPRAGSGRLKVAAESREEVLSRVWTITLEQPEYFLRGKVVGENGTPVPGARLSASSKLEAPIERSMSFDVPVDVNGDFLLACPRPGPWELTVGWTTVVRAEPGPEPIVLTVPGKRAVIRVVDELGRPVHSRFPQVHPVRSTPVGLRPEYRGLTRMGPRPGWGSTVIPRGAGDGVWSCELPREGTYALDLRMAGSSGQRWLGEDLFVVEPGDSVVEKTLVLRKAERGGPIEVSFLDHEGEPIPTWLGALHSTATGMQLDHFSEEGSICRTCMGAVHSELTWLAGDYRLELMASPRGFTLPAEGMITVRCGERARFTLQSPGVGGRLLLRHEKHPERDAAHASIVLTDRATGRRVGPHSLYRDPAWSRIRWALSPGARTGPDSWLLPPGVWEWRISAKGTPLDSGMVRIEAERRTELFVDLGD